MSTPDLPVDSGRLPALIPDREWHGELARAAGKGAQFSLFLAMHCQPGAEHFSLLPAEADGVTGDPHFPERLNHYKRPPLKPSDADYMALNTTAKMANSGSAAAFSLWQSMHPDPLSAHDNATLIPPEVKENCSLATRMRLQHISRPPEPVDETMLDEVISGSSSLLTA